MRTLLNHKNSKNQLLMKLLGIYKILITGLARMMMLAFTKQWHKLLKVL